MNANQSSVIQSLLPIQDMIEHIKIVNTDKIDKLKEILQGVLEQNKEIDEELLITQADWHKQGLYSQLAPIFGQPQLCDIIFIISALNFCFWKMDGNPHESFYKNVRYTGYWSLIASLLSAKEDNVNFTDYTYIISNQFNIDVLKKYFGNECPLLKLRFLILKDIAQIIHNKYNGTIRTLIEKNNMDSRLILDELVQSFPCFNDRCLRSNLQLSESTKRYNENDVIAMYDDVKRQQNNTNDEYLLFYKRAQIFLAELHYSKAVWLRNMGLITAFADYRIPQILHYLGYLEYDDYLTKILQERKLIYPGSKLECCIRASTILCVNCIKQQIEAITGVQVSAIFIDFMLWNYFKTLQAEKGENNFLVPMHRVLSWNY